MKRLWKWLTEVPHLFGKVVVSVCIVSGVGFSAWAFRILSRTDNDPSATLTVVLAFFGGELLSMAWKSIFKKKQSETEKPEGY